MALLKRKRAGMNDPMSVVTRFVNACNRHDADGVASCLHPDFDSIQPMYPSRNFRGADQVRRNWQAIFDAEPGFRLTVLRSAAMDDTVWVELHGAGRDAEVAGVFVMGIQGDRVRWARIYSALVEPLPPGAQDPTGASTTLRQVPPLDQSPAAENGEVVEEASIAPVLDMERTGRRRRRSSRRRSQEEAAEAPAADEPLAPEPDTQTAAEPQDHIPAEPQDHIAAEPQDQITAEPEVVAILIEEEAQEPDPEPRILVRPESDVEPEESEVQPEPQPEVVAEAPAADVPPVDEPPPKRRFGKKGR